MSNQNQPSHIGDKPKTCIIYTRANHDSGYTLHKQLEICEKFAASQGINVLGHFKGYAGDTRREFERMIAFAQANAQQLSYILVSTLDRFYSSGMAVSTATELQKNFGVKVVDANEPLETSSSAYDDFMKYIMMLLPTLDNNISREKIIAGKRRRALLGHWAGVPPRGYAVVASSGKETRLVLTSEAGLIKEAFNKRSEGTSIPGIRDWLRTKGFYVRDSRLDRMLKNCFYAGYIKSVYVPGKLIRGTHPAIIDSEIFFLINQINEDDEII